MTFNELNLDEKILSGLKDLAFNSCTLCQEKVLPFTLKGENVIVQSKTGSGKTAIFLTTILQKFISSNGKTKAIVIAPTRELAFQIEEDARKLAKYVDFFKCGCFYGGVGYKEQNQELEEDLALYVGTPGRLIDYAKSRKIDFRLFDIVVLDEADRMFDMGFFPDIRTLFSYMRDKDERETMLFSATMSERVKNLAWDYIGQSREIVVEPEEITVKNITQELFHVSKEEKFPLLLSILKKLNPSSCLIFTNTKEKAVEVSKRLNLNGYKSEYIMGDMAQSKRLDTIERMKEGKIRILVATDVAARGLQIDDLELVINYDIPEDYENYVHRIGRTARCGKSGKAITLACEEYIYGLEAIENYIGMKIPVLWPDECMLERVVDKSSSYRGPRKNRVKKPLKREPKTLSLNRSQRGKKERKSNNKNQTDFNALSHMTMEERMAYYKKQYMPKSEIKEKVEEKTKKEKRGLLSCLFAFFKGKKNG